MKKLLMIILICVLACSILVGALAHAKPPLGSKALEQCALRMFCEVSTCTLWYVYYCPWGELWVDMGPCCSLPSGGN